MFCCHQCILNLLKCHIANTNTATSKITFYSE